MIVCKCGKWEPGANCDHGPAKPARRIDPPVLAALFENDPPIEAAEGDPDVGTADETD